MHGRQKLILLAVSICLIVSPLAWSKSVHERLRLKNTFKRPEEVVEYYVNRDASGFIWSGLLDLERRAFTTWSQSPENDAFYIAKSYKIQPKKKTSKKATVRVTYSISGMGDGHGTKMPAPQPPKKEVDFELVNIRGRWKIQKPVAHEISPIVLESRFPY